MLVWTKEKSIALFGCWNAQKSLQRNATGVSRGVKLNSASHNQSKKCVRALHNPRSSTISQTRTSFFRFRLLYCVNCVLNLPMLNWCNSTKMIFKNLTCVKGIERFQSPAYCVQQEFWDTTSFNHVAETRNEWGNTQQKSRQFTLN